MPAQRAVLYPNRHDGRLALPRTAHPELVRAIETLRSAGIEQPAREARLLLAMALNLPEGALPDGAAPPPPRFGALLARRAAREPMAFLRGRAGFWTLDLEVSPATLIPRPDTETLVTAALEARPDRGRVRSILDLGTGTGALLLAAQSEFRGAFGVGIDIAPAACALAARNARSCGLPAAILCGDWDTPLAERVGFDLILSNPPYIPSAAISGLMPEVARHEPAAALDGGPDGLDAYRRLGSLLAARLAANGLAVLEVGIGQALQVCSILQTWLPRCTTRLDLAGVERAVVVDLAG